MTADEMSQALDAWGDAHPDQSLKFSISLEDAQQITGEDLRGDMADFPEIIIRAAYLAMLETEGI